MADYAVPKSGAAYIFYGCLVSQADTKKFQSSPTLAAGDFKVSIDGGAFANLATLPTNTPSGVSVKFSLSGAEMTGDNIHVVAIDAAGAEWCDQDWNIQTSPRGVGDLAYPATSGRSMVVDAAGLVDANTVKIGPTGAGAAQTARDIGTSVLLSSGTGTGQLKLASGYVAMTWADIAAPMTTVNLSGTTIATSQVVASVTGAVGSVTGAVGSVTGAVGSVTGNVGGNVTGSVGSVVGAVGSVTGNVGGNVTGTVASVVSPGNVFDVVLASHLTAGSTGFALHAAGSAGDPWGTALPGAYGSGTAGNIIGNRIDAAISSRMATFTQPTGFLAATFPASVASPTNITAGTIANVTNLTNAPTNGDLTVAMKASVTTAATAATPTAAGVSTTVNANIVRVNNVTVQGTGAPGDEWGP